MKLSIIIPIFNVAQWIEECIKSVASQTRKDFEVILVDDCGTDNSMTIVEKTLKELNANFPVKILHHECNRGLSAARNTGIQSAEGEYILFVDSDDQLLSNAVELLLGKAEQTGAEMVVGEIQMGGSSKGVWHIAYKEQECLGRDNIMLCFLKQQWYSMAWNKLIRSDFYRNHELFFEEGLIHEDGVWSFKVHCYAEHVAFVHAPTYIYNVRENSIQTDNNLQKHLTAFILVQELNDVEAKKSGVDNLPQYFQWQEGLKAWIYRKYVEPQNSSEIDLQFYRFVRSVAPNPRLTISHCHYYVWPYVFGMWLYKGTVGHLWKYE